MASESVRHGGSLDNLAKEELFLETTHTLMVMRDKPHNRGGRASTPAVSARQREGGKFDIAIIYIYVYCKMSQAYPANMPGTLLIL